jgi:hypothetical protein
MQGENAWVFVHEDDISDAVKFFNTFTEPLEKEAKAAAPKGVEVRRAHCCGDPRLNHYLSSPPTLEKGAANRAASRSPLCIWGGAV